MQFPLFFANNLLGNIHKFNNTFRASWEDTGVMLDFWLRTICNSFVHMAITEDHYPESAPVPPSFTRSIWWRTRPIMSSQKAPLLQYLFVAVSSRQAHLSSNSKLSARKQPADRDNDIAQLIGIQDYISTAFTSSNGQLDEASKSF